METGRSELITARVLKTNAGCSIFLVTTRMPDTDIPPSPVLSLRALGGCRVRGFFDSITIGRPGGKTTLSASSLPNQVNLNFLEPRRAPSFLETSPSTLGDAEYPLPWHFSHPLPLHSAQNSLLCATPRGFVYLQ